MKEYKDLEELIDKLNSNIEQQCNNRLEYYKNNFLFILDDGRHIKKITIEGLNDLNENNSELHLYIVNKNELNKLPLRIW